MAPLVSVIVPAYNMERYIGPAIESVLAQTYPNIEIIAINDGSPDGTLAVLRTYEDRITVVDQENQGPSAARNAGLRLARGELIALLDGDDLWFPERIQRLVDYLDEHPELDMVTSDSYVMDGETPTTKRSYIDRRKRPFPATVDEQIPEIARFNFLFIAVVFRRHLLDEHGMFHVSPRRGSPDSTEGAEDYELWTRYLLSGARAGFVDEPLGYYRVLSGSLSRRPQQSMVHHAVLAIHLPALWKQGAKGYARDAYDIGTQFAVRGERRRALPFFWHALTGEGARGSRARYLVSSVRRLAAPSDAHRHRHTPRG